MNEPFLYYVWQYQYFDRRDLKTTAGEGIEIFNPGTLNHHAGPDFSNASVRIGTMSWAGSVEIHTTSSAWLEHRHDTDTAYENVILHVVWLEDQLICRADGSALPTLVLKDRVHPSLLADYRKLIHNPFSIPCTRSFPAVDDLIKHSMLDRTLVHRLESKADEIIGLLKENNNDWEETLWLLLSRNFGFKVNSEPFQQLGKSLSVKLIQKHADKPLQVEALLFGQAGFLDVPVGDAHYLIVRREYELLAAKYSLQAKKMAKAQWRFLRLRPANFPTVRIAQFGALVQQHKSLFSKILDSTTPASLIRLFSARQNEYWLQHYHFNKKSRKPVPELGLPSVQNLLINSVVPLLAAWGKMNDDQSCLDRATGILQTLPAEDNAILREWTLLGYKAKTAFDSQALIELYHHFCRRKNCLTCVIGASLLKPKT